jgi:hypothetical protein
MALAGCAAESPSPESPSPESPIASQRFPPISKVTVHNMAADWRYVRLNWPDGFVQVYRVQPGTTQYLSGGIGTSGFPRTIMVLDSDCQVLATVIGLAPGSAGLLTIGESGARLEELVLGETTWGESGSVTACGATP